MANPAAGAISRRKILGMMAAGSALAAMPSWLGCAGRGDRPPNVLFLGIDDLNDWVGCLRGHRDAWTPHIDRLAQSGTLFTNAHCPAPLCGGSRTSLLTGLLPSTTGVYDNHQPFRPVRPDLVTLPQMFQRKGYRVLGSGKIFHVDDPESWDDYYHPTDEIPDRAWKPLKRDGSGFPRDPIWDFAPLDCLDEETYDGHLATWAAQRLSGELTEPFFLATGFLRPHLKWTAPREYFDRFPPDEVTMPVVLPRDARDVPKAARVLIDGRRHRLMVERGQASRAVAAYLACVNFVDAQVGRVLEALDAGPYSDRTVVVLWSDHGFHLGEKGHWGKYVLWEPATRVPLILRVPGGVWGERCSSPVSLLDVYPTLAELCGLDLPATLDGESLTPQLADATAPRSGPAITLLGPNRNSVRTARWRYSRYGPNREEELYDHHGDPLEWRNLARDPETEARRRELAAHFPTDFAPAAPRRGKTARHVNP